MKLRVLLALGLVASAAEARPPGSLLESILATVDGRPICRSEVLERAAPLLLQAPSRAKNEVQAEVLRAMIQERLIEKDAERGQLSVTSDEVDSGIRAVAAQMQVMPGDVVGAAQRQGYSERGYRDEIRRQILEQKWMLLRIKPRVTGAVTLEMARRDRLEELRKEITVEVLR